MLLFLLYERIFVYLQKHYKIFFMKAKILLENRDGEYHKLVMYGTGMYKFECAEDWMNDFIGVTEGDNGEVISIDPVSGPMISVGDEIEGVLIEQISFVPDEGIIICVKDNSEKYSEITDSDIKEETMVSEKGQNPFNERVWWVVGVQNDNIGRKWVKITCNRDVNYMTVDELKKNYLKYNMKKYGN